MDDFSALEIECFLMGVVGGMLALGIGLMALKKGLTIGYMRYRNCADIAEVQKRAIVQQAQILNMKEDISIINKKLEELIK